MSVTTATLRRLMRELSELQSSPPEGIRVVTSEDNMLDVIGIIKGPDGTPYAGGYFRVKFKFTEEFPAAPPKCWFVTKIFHPNVGPTGEICVSTLKKDWKSSYGIGHILLTVKCLLIYPNPESALDEEAGKLLLEAYDGYCERARLITSVHATPRVPPPEFTTASSEDTQPAAQPAPKPISKSSTTVYVKPVSSGPLQTAPSNTISPADSVRSLAGKERLTSPSPLGTADSNVVPVPASAAVTKAVKRAAVGNVAGAEKRKKALKRL